MVEPEKDRPVSQKSARMCLVSHAKSPHVMMVRTRDLQRSYVRYEKTYRTRWHAMRQDEMFDLTSDVKTIKEQIWMVGGYVGRWVGAKNCRRTHLEVNIR